MTEEEYEGVRQHVDAENRAWAALMLSVQPFPLDVTEEVVRLVWERDAITNREINDFTLAVWMDMLEGRDPDAVLDAARMVCAPGFMTGDVAFCHVYQAARLFEGLPYGP